MRTISILPAAILERCWRRSRHSGEVHPLMPTTPRCRLRQRPPMVDLRPAKPFAQGHARPVLTLGPN